MRKRKLKTTKYGVLTADETIAVRDFVAGLSFVLIFLPYMTGTRVAAFACTHCKKFVPQTRSAHIPGAGLPRPSTVRWRQISVGPHYET